MYIQYIVDLLLKIYKSHKALPQFILKWIISIVKVYRVIPMFWYMRRSQHRSNWELKYKKKTVFLNCITQVLPTGNNLKSGAELHGLVVLVAPEHWRLGKSNGCSTIQEHTNNLIGIWLVRSPVTDLASCNAWSNKMNDITCVIIRKSLKHNLLEILEDWSSEKPP